MPMNNINDYYFFNKEEEIEKIQKIHNQYKNSFMKFVRREFAQFPNRLKKDFKIEDIEKFKKACLENKINPQSYDVNCEIIIHNRIFYNIMNQRNNEEKFYNEQQKKLKKSEESKDIIEQRSKFDFIFPEIIYNGIRDSHIKNGKVYDTSVSKQVEIFNFDKDTQSFSEILYLTKNNNWFIYAIGKENSRYNYYGKNGCCFIPLEKEEVLQWLQSHRFYSSIEKYFSMTEKIEA